MLREEAQIWLGCFAMVKDPSMSFEDTVVAADKLLEVIESRFAMHRSEAEARHVAICRSCGFTASMPYRLITTEEFEARLANGGWILGLGKEGQEALCPAGHPL